MHPKVPNHTQIRPIAINSAVVKLLESRLLPKLQDYLKAKLHRSQIGFVDNMDVYVNIWRALERIQELRTSKKYCTVCFLILNRHIILLHITFCLKDYKVSLMKRRFS